VRVTCRDVLCILTGSSSSSLLPPPAVSVSASASAHVLTWVSLGGTSGYVEVAEASDATSLPPPPPPASSVSPYQLVTYTDAEHDLLALFATAAKVLFLQGRLGALPALFQLLEPARMQARKPLHETSIRNEMAYFQEVGQLLCFRSAHCCYGLLPLLDSDADAAAATASPLVRKSCALTDIDLGFGTGTGATATVSASNSVSTPSATGTGAGAAQRPLYVLGDSHCVASAWSVLRISGAARVLVPRLATGIKIWHLRKGSVFYPKAHFFHMAASIPDGSDVRVAAISNSTAIVVVASLPPPPQYFSVFIYFHQFLLFNAHNYITCIEKNTVCR
jgi:hypothetical protein